MKFLSFLFITLIILLTISIKLVIVNQDTKIKNLDNNISKIKAIIEKKKTDISYSTRPQLLEEINKEKFNFLPILQSDIIKIKSE